MATYAWPAADKRTLIGARVPRVDGPQKTTGVAKYAYDINRPGMLYAKLVTSPHAKARHTAPSPRENLPRAFRVRMS